MLDLAVWVREEEDNTKMYGQKQIVSHSFYEKKCSSSKVMMSSSALPIRMKISTLANDIKRRLRNCGRSITIGEKVEIVNCFMVKLKKSGYSERLRREILEAGLKGFYRMLETEQTTGIRVNQSPEIGREEREIRRTVGAGSWHKRTPGSVKGKPPGGPRDRNVGGGGSSKGGREVGEVPTLPSATPLALPTHKSNPRTEAIIFIPATPNGELVKRLQAIDDSFAKVHNLQRIRYIEQGGTKLENLLGRKNPWAGEKCQKVDCWPCSGSDEKGWGQCQEENIVYNIKCEGCTALGIVTNYTGESSRNSYLRGKEHKSGLIKEDENSVLWQHCQEEHEGVIQKFSMKVVRKHRSSFERQVHEAVAILTDKEDIILNRKSEFNDQKIPRLAVEVNDRALQVENNGHEIGKREREEAKTSMTTTKKPKVQSKVKPKESKNMKGQKDIRDLLKPRPTKREDCTGQRSGSGGTGLERGGGQGGRDNLPLPSSSPIALPPAIILKTRPEGL